MTDKSFSVVGELSGIELRKAIAAALGWALEDDSVNGVTYFRLVDETGAHRGGGTPEYVWEDCPHFESDPAAFWLEFEKWLAAENEGKEIRDQIFGGCQFYTNELADFQIIRRDDGETIADTAGATILEAGCRAWLEAMSNQIATGADIKAEANQ